jgi:thiol-disulfide isomerase/thioredoxin
MRVTLLKGKIELQFQGGGKEINEYLLAKRQTLGYHDLRGPSFYVMKPRAIYNQILIKIDSMVKIELDFLETYLGHRNLPDWFIQYETAEIEYLGAGYKGAVPKTNELFNYFEDTLPSNYFDFLSSITINNEKAILSTKYFMFLDDYFLRDSPKEFDHLGGYARAVAMGAYTHRKSKEMLSGQAADIYNQILFSRIARRTSDSSKTDSLAKAFGIGDVDKFKTLVGRDATGNPKFKNLQTGDQVMEFFVTNENDRLVSMRDYYKKIVYINFWATWCRPCLANMPEHNKLIENFAAHDQIVFMNICLSSPKDQWKRAIKKANLQGINVFAEGNWTEKLEAEFGIKSFPQYTLLGTENRIVERDTDKAPGIKSKIDKLLEATAKQ